MIKGVVDIDGSELSLSDKVWEKKIRWVLYSN